MSDRRSIEEKNDERLLLHYKRWHQKLTAKEEKKYQRLHRAMMRYCRIYLPGDYESMKRLNRQDVRLRRAGFTLKGKYLQEVKKRIKARKLAKSN